MEEYIECGFSSQRDFDLFVGSKIDMYVGDIKLGIRPKKQIWYMKGDIIHMYDFYSKKICLDCINYNEGNCVDKICDVSECVSGDDFFMNMALARRMFALGYLVKVVCYSLEEDDGFYFSLKKRKKK